MCAQGALSLGSGKRSRGPRGPGRNYGKAEVFQGCRVAAQFPHCMHERLNMGMVTPQFTQFLYDRFMTGGQNPSMFYVFHDRRGEKSDRSGGGFLVQVLKHHVIQRREST